MQTRMRVRPAVMWVLAVILGLGVAVFDQAALFGDDTSKPTLLLLIACGGVLGLMNPGKPWRWAIAAAIGLPLVSMVTHALGYDDNIHPNTYLARLLLLPVALVATLIGAYAGALLRRFLDVRPLRLR